MLRCILAFFAATLTLLDAAAPGRADEPFDFRREVGPLLAKRCASCHNPAEKKGSLDLTTRAAALAGGDGGAAIVPGRPDNSPTQFHDPLGVQAVARWFAPTT
jgi:hypothetical protein